MKVIIYTHREEFFLPPEKGSPGEFIERNISNWVYEALKERFPTEISHPADLVFDVDSVMYNYYIELINKEVHNTIEKLIDE